MVFVPLSSPQIESLKFSKVQGLGLVGRNFTSQEKRKKKKVPESSLALTNQLCKATWGFTSKDHRSTRP